MKNRLLGYGFVVFMALSMTACKSTSLPPDADIYSQAAAIKSEGGVYKVGKPYKVLGQYYEPKEDYNYSETGIASWYGKDFHAKKTANGENYDMNTLTADHRTLPLPSIVKVTNLENGRSLVLRVNDRGPFAKNRIIDISKRGAQLLGYQEQGTAKVRVEVLAQESQELKYAMLNDVPPAMAAPVTKIVRDGEDVDRNYLIGAGKDEALKSYASNDKIFVQAGSFTYKSSADELSDKLKNFGEAKVAQASIDGHNFYRVRLGPFSHEEEAHVALARVKSYGVYNAKIIRD